MIVISAGIQKAGTGWYFNMTNDLLIVGGGQDVRKIKEQYRLHRMLKYYNCNIGRPLLIKLAILMLPNFLGNTFVVKTHSSPPSSWPILAQAGLVRATYIYRDPRDVVISAYEHGKQLREQGETHSFARLNSIEEAISTTAKWLKTWQSWQSSPQTLLVRYEELKADPLNELHRLARFLGISLPDETLNHIVTRYQNETLKQDESKGLHFNIGKTQRFRTLMKDSELRLCAERFGPYLEKMGYEES